MFTANYVYLLPLLQGSNAFVKNVLGGWELSGIVTYNSGLPLTVTSSLGNDPGGLGIIGPSAAGPRPDVIGNAIIPDSDRTINRWFNRAAFAEVPVGVFRPGNSGRGTITAPGIVKWDFSVFKQFAVTERVRFQLRGEAFNVLNHTNYNAPTVALGNANFGRILGARDPRNIQIGAKLIF